MRIRIINPGMLTTVQDMGRRLYLPQAVPISGAMDTFAARIANIAIGNHSNDAIIEFTYANAKFVAETDLLIAYAGDGARLACDEAILPASRPVFIPCGKIINLVNNPAGARTYLAIAGGWDVPEVLGSRSTFLTAAFGGKQGRALQTGDILSSIDDPSPISTQILDSVLADKPNYPAWSLTRQRLLATEKKVIRVVPGNELNWFTDKSVVDFFSAPYTLSLRSNRMGYHLDGPVINRKKKEELLSTAVTPGTIQVTGSGGMILLMADCQTTGGYPRIGQVAAVDLPVCGQLKPGDAIFFQEIMRPEAERLYIERENHLQKLSNAVRSRFLC